MDTLPFSEEVSVMGGKTRPPYPAEYRARIMEKLNLHHRSELIKYALKKGVLKAHE